DLFADDVIDMVGSELFRITDGVFLRDDLLTSLQDIQSETDVPEIWKTELAIARPDPDGNGLVRRYDGITLSGSATIAPLIDDKKWQITDGRQIYTVELLDNHLVVRGGWRVAGTANIGGRVYDIFEFNDGFRPWLTGVRLLVFRELGFA
ncbi:MAG: hypothetical protein KDA81_21500, partial [Planctomycetaceae bacterium]|nr:hypothetical protein [Planctomycetaceae bacterium]